MAACKRPAAVLDAGHATATQGSAVCSKRSRTSIGTIHDYGEIYLIGEGGFGIVHKARHRVTGKTFAIKHISAPAEDTEEPSYETEEPLDVSEEILREARFLEACSGNPYVVGFEGLLHDPDNGEISAVVMEYVDAPSLKTFLRDRRSGPPLGESTVRAVMWKLLTGAKMMHDRHVVHRDIKPGNILVSQDGELVKICDFGLATSITELPPYTHAGTACYIAPEMLLEKPDYDALVDTWSLGCVMAEMLTGDKLFPAEDNEINYDEQEDEINYDEEEYEINYDEEEEEIYNVAVQLWSIFQVLGMPDERTWPGFTSLPLTAEVLQQLPAGHKHNRLRDLFPEEKLSEQGFEVLQGLLTCNPDKRLTAAKALKHPWFSAPCPAAAARVEAFVALPRKEAPGITFIPPVVPEKITFKIPVAVWDDAQRV